MASPEANSASTNQGPSFVRQIACDVDGLSTKIGVSSWRELDSEREQELRETFLNGSWGLSILGGVTALDEEDFDGQRVVDDGLHTASVVKGLKGEWVKDASTDPNGRVQLLSCK